MDETFIYAGNPASPLVNVNITNALIIAGKLRDEAFERRLYSLGYALDHQMIYLQKAEEQTKPKKGS